MDFSDALTALKRGKKVSRGIWHASGDVHAGAVIELVGQHRAEGHDIMPMLMMSWPGSAVMRPFAGANWDLLAEDWEVTGE